MPFSNQPLAGLVLEPCLLVCYDSQPKSRLSNIVDQFAEHHTQEWFGQINPIEAINNDASNQCTLFLGYYSSPVNFKTTGEINWTESVFLRGYASLFCTMLVSSINVSTLKKKIMRIQQKLCNREITEVLKL